jgi:hypothetical protein
LVPYGFILVPQVRSSSIYQAIRDYQVNSLNGAPTVMDTIAFAPSEEAFVAPYPVQVFTGVYDRSFLLSFIHMTSIVCSVF